MKLVHGIGCPRISRGGKFPSTSSIQRSLDLPFFLFYAGRMVWHRIPSWEIETGEQRHKEDRTGGDYYRRS
ncbi:unnamed protein product [Nezara viridula]|uniref:Uncharacterized protein n=1 Tax=Nezara viridula TaxID=85310 RepID=A0A9P0HKR9_NEZVI|nr:unnamed protein product [Nezara viridula]